MYSKLSVSSPLFNTLRTYENLLKATTEGTTNLKTNDIVEHFNFAGYDPAGLSITVKDRVISITMSKDGKVVSREDFTIAKGYDLDNIKAEYKFGLLTVTIPKQTLKEQTQPRSVSVNVTA